MHVWASGPTKLDPTPVDIRRSDVTLPFVKLNVGSQNLTLQGGPNVLRYATDASSDNVRDVLRLLEALGPYANVGSTYDPQK
ncbi:hypothetical protein TNCV_2391471 [Trichonephila clavipes]|nr:hypothetical protein TNCV_2391471 [Trichonephila clavipes]